MDSVGFQVVDNAVQIRCYRYPKYILLMQSTLTSRLPIWFYSYISLTEGVSVVDYSVLVSTKRPVVDCMQLSIGLPVVD